MAFKVGDRVRIDVPTADTHGKQATVYAIGPWPTKRWGYDAREAGCRWWHRAYLVDIDGLGKRSNNGGPFGFPAMYLRPLTPPAEDTWAADAVKRVTKQHPDFQPSVREVFEHYKSLQTE